MHPVRDATRYTVRGDDVDRPDRSVVPLQLERPSVDVGEAFDLRSEVDHGLRGEHLSGYRLRAQPRGEVERPAAISAFDRDRFTGIEPDPDAAGKLAFAQPGLHRDACPQRVARRDEDDQGFVAAQLEKESLVRLGDLTNDVGEPRCEGPGRFVSVLAGVRGVPADVGDQEGAELGASVVPVVTDRDHLRAPESIACRWSLAPVAPVHRQP